MQIIVEYPTTALWVIITCNKMSLMHYWYTRHQNLTKIQIRPSTDFKRHYWAHINFISSALTNTINNFKVNNISYSILESVMKGRLYQDGYTAHNLWSMLASLLSCLHKPSVIKAYVSLPCNTTVCTWASYNLTDILSYQQR